jgi:hypothetical protein
MDWIVLEGVKPWDGRYEFDIVARELTRREWGWIKRLPGYLPLTIEDGLRGADPELFAVFGAIALRRAGRIQQDEVPEIYERLLDAPAGSTIRLEGDTVDTDEGDAGPPPASSSGNGSSFGSDSPTSSETSESIPPSPGIPALATSTSPPKQWGT